MDGTAVQKLVEETRKPTVMTVGGEEILVTPDNQVYGGFAGWPGRDGQRLYPRIPAVEKPLQFPTLCGLIRYAVGTPRTLPGAAPAEKDGATDFVLHVSSFRSVAVVGSLEWPSLQRRTFARAVPSTQMTDYPYGKWLDPETALIAIRQAFTPSADRGYLLDLLATLREELVTTREDNGVTQMATVKTGLVMAEKIPVRPELDLFPMGLTFEEVDPKEPLHCAVRLKGGGPDELPKVLLAATNLPEWEERTVERIRNWIANEIQTIAAVDGEPSKEIPVL